MSAARQIANLPGWKGKKTEEVVPEAPPFPDVIGYLWGYYNEISPGLSINGMAPPVVTWENLAAWCLLTRTILEAWEARALVRLGSVRAMIESEKAAKAAKTSKP